MARAINKDKYFRWHDSGDIQGLEHFAKIVEVARATPNTLHWLPTREAQTVASYTGTLPDNLLSEYRGDG
jgi:hypothetical protein